MLKLYVSLTLWNWCFVLIASRMFLLTQFGWLTFSTRFIFHACFSKTDKNVSLNKSIVILIFYGYYFWPWLLWQFGKKAIFIIWKCFRDRKVIVLCMGPLTLMFESLRVGQMWKRSLLEKEGTKTNLRHVWKCMIYHCSRTWS
jgi:hypothetical protein